MAATDGIDAQTLVKAAQRLLIHGDVDRILDAIDGAAMTKEAKCAPGHGNPPPPGQKPDPQIEGLPEKLQGKAYTVKGKVPKPGFPKATSVATAIASLLEKRGKKRDMPLSGKKKGRKTAMVVVARKLLVKKAAEAIVAIKHGNKMEKQGGAAFLSKIIPLLGRLGGGAGRLLGRGLGAAGAAAGKAGLGGVGKALGGAAKAIPTSVGAGSRGAGLGALLAGGGLAGVGAAAGRMSKRPPKPQDQQQQGELQAEGAA